jgi:hypothetical protein
MVLRCRLSRPVLHFCPRFRHFKVGSHFGVRPKKHRFLQHRFGSVVPALFNRLAKPYFSKSYRIRVNPRYPITPCSCRGTREGRHTVR